MPIGVVGYTVRFHTFTADQVKDTYKRIAEMGYDGLETVLGRAFFSPEEELALLRTYGLSICDTYADITKPDEAMKAAEAYGVKILGIPSVPNEMLRSPDGFKAYAQRINAWAKPFEGTGMRLQYHNHSQEFRNFPELGGKTGMSILIGETNPDVVIFELDTHWLAAAGCDPAQWIRSVKGRIPIVHFKDYAVDCKDENTGMGYVPRQFAEIGQGNINWPNVVEACKYAGAKWVLVEQDKTVPNAFDSLKTSIDFIKTLDIS